MRKLLLLVLLLAACPRPQPGDPPKPGLVQCGGEAVQNNWPRVLPAVNRCLASMADSAWLGCLLGLIDPVAGITSDVIRCVTADSGKKFGDAALHNRSDAISERAAARAQEFNRGWSFATPGAP